VFYDKSSPCQLKHEAIKINGGNQWSVGYWRVLYRLWLKHMKQYHPEKLEYEETADRLNGGGKK
jgi:hypothetical protein